MSNKERIAELEAELEMLRDEEYARQQAEEEVSLKNELASFISKNKKHEKFIKTLMKEKSLDEGDLDEIRDIYFPVKGTYYVEVSGSDDWEITYKNKRDMLTIAKSHMMYSRFRDSNLCIINTKTGKHPKFNVTVKE